MVRGAWSSARRRRGGGASRRSVPRAVGRSPGDGAGLVGRISHEPRSHHARRFSEGDLQRLPRLRTRRVQEPGSITLREVPRERSRASPWRRRDHQDRLSDLPRVRAEAAGTDVHLLPRQIRETSRRHCHARYDRVRGVPQDPWGACDRSEDLYAMPLRKRAGARLARGLPRLPRLPQRSRSCDRCDFDVLLLPRKRKGFAARCTRRLSRLSQAARVRGRGREFVPGLSRSEADILGFTRRCTRVVPHLPCTPCTPGGRSVLSRLPHGHRGQPRRKGGVHHLPRSSSERPRYRGQHVHDLPREHRDFGHDGTRGWYCVREVPRTTRLRPSRQGDPLHNMPRARDEPRGAQSRARGLRVVSWIVDTQAHRGARLRKLPCKGAEHRSERPPGVPGLPRAPRRLASGQRDDVYLVPRK